MLLAVDTNANMTVDLGELNDLTLRIALALELRGIKLDAERFRAIIRSDNSICHVLNGKPNGEFMCAPRDFIPDSTSASATAVHLFGDTNVEEACRTVTWGNVPRSREVATPAAPLFVLQDRLTRGSVAAARGIRPCLDASCLDTVKAIQHSEKSSQDRRKSKREARSHKDT